jgi:hypothetical protein
LKTVKTSIDHYCKKLIRSGKHEISWSDVKKAMWDDHIADLIEADLLIRDDHVRVKPFKKIFLTLPEQKKYYRTKDI